MAPTADEVRRSAPGDDLVPAAAVVMDRGFSVPAPPAEVWPWLVQLGKARAGWYLPRRVERLLPVSRRALRRIEPRWQGLRVGDVVPDYGGPHETFEVARIDPPAHLVYRSRRGRTELSWSISLASETSANGDPGTRVHLRLRLGPVRHRWLAHTGGELLDLLTVAGMAAGLVERVRSTP